MPIILTRQNFWNNILQKYPELYKIFIEWIAEYKARPECDFIFFPSYDSELFPEEQKLVEYFENVPIALQIGIFLQYVAEEKEKFYGIEYYIETPGDWELMPGIIEKWFEEEQDRHDREFSIGKYALKFETPLGEKIDNSEL